MKINERGYWENPTQEGHGVDLGLARGLVQFFNKVESSSVIDIGCGNGFYTNYLLEHDIFCRGYDGNPFTKEITDGLCSVADFSKPVRLGLYDWVLSLEVGEHIPVEYEDVFVDNLKQHAYSGIVLSWSIPEYGGDGHVNPRNNDYIINKMKPFVYNRKYTTFLRDFPANYPNPCYWFKETLMVFVAEDR